MSTEDILREMNGKLDDVREWQLKQSVVCEQRGELLTELKRTLWGNGRPGLDSRVQKLENYGLAATKAGKIIWAGAIALAGVIGALIQHIASR